MPRLIYRIPKYRHHKRSGLAVVTIDGRDHYLGKHGSNESRAMYRRLIAEWNASGRRSMPADSTDGLTLVELIARYWRFCQTYYTKNGELTSEVGSVAESMKPLRELYGRLPAAEFGPLKLKTVREEMIKKGWARTTVNGRIQRIRKMFKWAVENEILKSDKYEALRAVAGLRKGRTTAREPKRVLPVNEDHVQAILPHVSDQVSAMICLQLLTGMRSGEVTIMRGIDIDMSAEVWQYRPSHHKTEHHEVERLIPLGPRAQELIRPFLNRDLSAYLFSPAEAEVVRLVERHAARKTPLSCGNRPGSTRKRRRRRPARDRYDTDTYRRAISRGCDVAFPAPTGLTANEIEAWQRDHRFHPHQLRHTAATQIRRTHGLEAAKCILGHTNIETTQIYAEVNQAQATSIMAQVG